MAMPVIRMHLTFSTEATRTMWEALLALTLRAVLQLLAAGALAVKGIAVLDRALLIAGDAPVPGRSDLE
jgi:hypothetical protein